MANPDQHIHFLNLLKEVKMDSVVKPSFSIKVADECDSMIIPMDKDVKEQKHGVQDNTRENKVVRRKESSSSALEKLQSFFEIVQKQHPESHLELQCVDGNWKVWCGVCKKLLRPDKSGKAIHNIQRQHFASSRHKKKLNLILQAEEDNKVERKKITATKGGKEMQSKHEHMNQSK